MPLTHSLGTANLPMPKADDPFGMEYMPFGVALRTANATYRVQLTGAKWRVRVNFEGLTKAERDTTFAAFQSALATAQTYVMPEGTSISVMTGLNSWQESHAYDPHDGVWYYNCSFTVEQV
jgi:hypothetical protein